MALLHNMFEEARFSDVPRRALLARKCELRMWLKQIRLSCARREAQAQGCRKP